MVTTRVPSHGTPYTKSFQSMRENGWSMTTKTPTAPAPKLAGMAELGTMEHRIGRHTWSKRQAKGKVYPLHETVRKYRCYITKLRNGFGIQHGIDRFYPCIFVVLLLWLLVISHPFGPCASPLHPPFIILSTPSAIACPRPCTLPLSSALLDRRLGGAFPTVGSAAAVTASSRRWVTASAAGHGGHGATRRCLFTRAAPS